MTLQEKEELKNKVADNPKWAPKETVVGMVQKPAAELPAAVAVALAPEHPERNTVTRWDAFVDLKLTPTFIRCNSYYHRAHPGDDSCHTTMQLSPEQMIRHMDSGHSGAFFMSFRDGYADAPQAESPIKQFRAWDGWKEFEQLGIEIMDFRCAVCDKELRLTARSIMPHLKAHTGNSSRRKPGGDFWLTLSREFTSGVDDEE